MFTDTPDRAPSAIARASARSASAFAQRHLEVARIDLDEEIARLHLLVVPHAHDGHDATDFRGDRRNVPVDLRIVSGLPTGQMHPCGDGHRGEHEAASDNPPHAPTRRGRGGRGGH